MLFITMGLIGIGIIGLTHSRCCNACIEGQNDDPLLSHEQIVTLQRDRVAPVPVRNLPVVEESVRLLENRAQYVIAAPASQHNVFSPPSYSELRARSRSR